MSITPLSLYIHIPWCIKKCPYCDFNSHVAPETIPENEYITALQQDLITELSSVQDRTLTSIFFGGGTPSLFSAQAIENILSFIKQNIPFSPNIEITLECNPGTIEHHLIEDYKNAGITRISLGVQSFQDNKLSSLGRIHSAAESYQAIDHIHNADFTSFNIDLMYGLPNQTIDDALLDLQAALQLKPPHISWYNLTIEPNTYFAKHQPKLPDHDLIYQMTIAGQELLTENSIPQYEISAYAIDHHQCKHNKNYWEFGDYIGIGAGAHSKITDLHNKTISRNWKTRHPQKYMQDPQNKNLRTIATEELPFEFMLNALRLTNGFPKDLFTKRTALPLKSINSALQRAITNNYLQITDRHINPTEHGKRFLDNLCQLFLA